MDNSIDHAVKSIFLECIKDPQIIESLKNLLSGDWKTGESMQSPLDQKLDQLLQQQNSIMLLLEKASISELKTESEQIHKQIHKEKEEWMKEEQRKSEQFQVAQEGVQLWEHRKLLSDSSRNYICQLCGSDEFYAFVSLGRDETKIAQLWSYVKEKAVQYEEHEQEVTILNDFFEFCIQVANEINASEERYSFYEPNIDDAYHMESCIKTCNSRQIGNIKKIIVRGVKQKDQIKFKSIVQID